jgi:hypothetical protein
MMQCIVGPTRSDDGPTQGGVVIVLKAPPVP